MTILNFNLDSIGQSGQSPKFVYIETNNTSAEVLATGFLNGLVSEGSTLSDTSMALVSTKATPNARTAQSNLYNITYANGDWSLTSESAPGVVSIAGSVTTNNLAVFGATTDTISDAGIAKSAVATYTGATVIGNVTKFNSVLGQTIDSGIAASALATYTGATVVGNIAQFNSTTGQTIDSGKSKLLIPYITNSSTAAVASATNTITVAGMVNTDVVHAEFTINGTPTTYIVGCAAGTGSFTITTNAATSTNDRFSYVAWHTV